jgi:hypothetical protein
MTISAPFGVSGGRELPHDLLPRVHCIHGANTGSAPGSIDATHPGEAILAHVDAQCTRVLGYESPTGYRRARRYLLIR